MPKKTRGQPVKKDGNEYEQGYLAGLQAAFEDAELDAFYAGVGYAKHASGDKHIGFNSDREREQFENGMRNKDNHFRSYTTREPTFLERLFGIQVSRRDSISSGRNKKKEERRKQIYKAVKRTWKRGKNNPPPW